ILPTAPNGATETEPAQVGPPPMTVPPVLPTPSAFPGNDPTPDAARVASPEVVGRSPNDRRSSKARSRAKTGVGLSVATVVLVGLVLTGFFALRSRRSGV